MSDEHHQNHITAIHRSGGDAQPPEPAPVIVLSPYTFERREDMREVQIVFPRKQLLRWFITHTAAGIISGLVVYVIIRHPRFQEVAGSYIDMIRSIMP